MTQSPIIRQLQRETSRIGLSGFVTIAVLALVLWASTTPTTGFSWFIVSTFFWLLVITQTSKRLALNRANADTALFTKLGWANRMTITRGWLIAACAGLLVTPTLLENSAAVVWTAAAAYSIAAIFDRLDGFVARKTQQSTQLGAELDTVFDALGLMVAPLLALQLGKIHWTYLLVSVAYYLFVIGIKIRKHNQLVVYPLAPSELRRTLAGFQMAYVAVVLWPPFNPEVTVLAGFGFMLPLLAGFLVDWWVVSGRLDPYAPDGSSIFARLKTFSNTYLLPVVRFVLLITLMLIWADASVAHRFILFVLVLAAAMMVCGLAGRAGAMLMLMVLAWRSPLPLDQAPFALCLFISIVILLLGCGRFSLWQADDHWVNRQDGA